MQRRCKRSEEYHFVIIHRTGYEILPVPTGNLWHFTKICFQSNVQAWVGIQPPNSRIEGFMKIPHGWFLKKILRSFLSYRLLQFLKKNPKISIDIISSTDKLTNHYLPITMLDKLSSNAVKSYKIKESD